MIDLATVAPAQRAFRALADPTRCQILLHLERQNMTIGEITDCFPVTRAAIKKHLTILEEGDLITVQARGRQRINSLNPRGMKHAADWINHFSRFWDDRLIALKEAVENGD